MSLVHRWRRFCVGVNSRTHRYLDSVVGTDYTDYMTEDWDTLVILDGARYDLFREIIDFNGTVERRTSPGSNSPQFIRATFQNRKLRDTIYVTANPFVYLLTGNEFYTIENLLESHWNNEVKVVPPAAVTEAATTIHDRYPRKRVIVQYMQPHFPFLGPTGKQFNHAGVAKNLDEVTEGMNPWFELIDTGEVDPKLVIQAYRENYQVVWPAVESLLDTISGRVVITSDHGNLLGERSWPIPIKLYGHPLGIQHDGLRTVPWAIREADERREIASESPHKTKGIDETEVKDQLEALGYK